MTEFEEIKRDLNKLLDNTYMGNISKLPARVSKTRFYGDRVEDITIFLDNLKRPPIISFRIYCILNDINSYEKLPVCPICKKPKSFSGISKGFMSTCGNRSCVQSLPEVIEKKHKTAIKNFGSLKEAYYDTANKTIKEKYKVDNISQSESIKEQKRETSRKNYGTDYPWQSEKGKEEQKNGVKKKYNVDNISQLEEIKEKKKQTFLKNYNVDNIFSSKEFKSYIRQFLLDTYGVTNWSQLEFIKNKKTKSYIKNFGYDHHMKHPLYIEYFSKLSEYKIEQKRKIGSQVMPGYSEIGCKIIDQYSKIFGYNFKHAENGGEFYIKELNYWVDGYDKEKNVVIEIDEEGHYLDNELREHDKIRQKKIEDFLDCKFIRIRLKELLND
jgi:hypothetical protein